MPLAELMHKWKHGESMSNGQKVQSQAQAVAIWKSEQRQRGRSGRGMSNARRKRAIDRKRGV